MQKQTIGVAGFGFVGKHMADFFRTHYTVKIYDPGYLENAPMIENAIFVKTLKDLKDCALTAVCVPTPIGKDGECDVSMVEKTVRELECPLILIKSTVTPGTSKQLASETMKNIVFSPEFAGESTYWSPYAFDKNMQAAPYFIFGGNRFVSELIVDIFAPIVGPTKKFHFTDWTTAELVKYWENTYFALKVTFCNEMYDICKKMDLSYWEARDLWLLDPRVEAMHTAVFADKRGFGGKCFPKDTRALSAACKKLNYEPKLIDAMIKRNEEFKEYNEELLPAEKPVDKEKKKS